MFRKILVAIDGSEGAKKALQAGIELAKFNHAGAVHDTPVCRADTREEQHGRQSARG